MMFMLLKDGNVFIKMKLNKEEKELLKSYDNGELKSIKDFTYITLPSEKYVK